MSLAMWSTCMQFVGEEGVTVADLQRLARTATNLAGMQRWGYIVVEPDPVESRPKRPRPDAVVRPTPAGRKAQEVWRPLSGDIEQRWQERFGSNEIEQLREALWAVDSQLPVELPDCLPILGYGLFSRGHLYWLLRISVLKQGSKQHSEQLYGHLPAGEMERKRT
jgi:hypothetical protein